MLPIENPFGRRERTAALPPAIYDPRPGSTVRIRGRPRFRSGPNTVRESGHPGNCRPAVPEHTIRPRPAAERVRGRGPESSRTHRMKTVAVLAVLAGCAGLSAWADDKAPKLEGKYTLISG